MTLSNIIALKRITRLRKTKEYIVLFQNFLLYKSDIDLDGISLIDNTAMTSKITFV